MFQSNGFQSNAFQSVLGAIKDTHDFVKRRTKKILLPIYEYTKKKKPVKIEVEQELALTSEDVFEKNIAPLPVKAVEWDNSAIIAHAKETMQTIDNIERQIAALREYERNLGEEEEDFFELVKLIAIH